MKNVGKIVWPCDRFQGALSWTGHNTLHLHVLGTVSDREGTSPVWCCKWGHHTWPSIPDPGSASDRATLWVPGKAAGGGFRVWRPAWNCRLSLQPGPALEEGSRGEVSYSYSGEGWKPVTCAKRMSQASPGACREPVHATSRCFPFSLLLCLPTEMQATAEQEQSAASISSQIGKRWEDC